jgi:hypothetical protein
MLLLPTLFIYDPCSFDELLFVPVCGTHSLRLIVLTDLTVGSERSNLLLLVLLFVVWFLKFRSSELRVWKLQISLVAQL